MSTPTTKPKTEEKNRYLVTMPSSMRERIEENFEHRGLGHLSFVAMSSIALSEWCAAEERRRSASVSVPQESHQPAA